MLESLLELDLNPPDVAIAASLGAQDLRVPFTPHFHPEVAASVSLVAEFGFGAALFQQFKNEAELDEYEVVTDAPICGFEAYRRQDIDWRWETSSSSWVEYSVDFNAEDGTIDLVADSGGEIGTVPSYPHVGTHTCTASTAQSGWPFDDPPRHADVSLSLSADKTWLTGVLASWSSQSLEFRTATATGTCGASESDAGMLAWVGGGTTVLFGPGFTDAAAEIWNDNFSALARIVERRNAPVVHAEACMEGGTLQYGAPYVASGEDIYRAGYIEVELSGLVGDKWRDDCGVFEQETALDGRPYAPASPEVAGADMLLHVGEGQANELLLVSRTGAKYRVTLSIGVQAPGGYEAVQTHVLATAEDTLRATLSIADAAGAEIMRVERVEVWRAVDGEEQWVVLADADEYAAWVAGGMLPPTVEDPLALLGSSAVSEKKLLLVALRVRAGERYGHVALVPPYDDRYLTKEYRCHRSPGTVATGTGGCGTATLTGSADLEWVESYDATTGRLLPRELTQFELTLNGTDWTQDDYAAWDDDYPVGAFGSLVESTATLRRREAEYEWPGRYVIAADEADPAGAILAEEIVDVAMTYDETAGRHVSAPVDMAVPAGGRSRYHVGHRLYYGDF